jgi:hypothetical protein
MGPTSHTESAVTYYTPEPRPVVTVPVGPSLDFSLMERLVRATPPQSMIADPCAGSGSTLLAARNLLRPAIGVECVEKYAEIAARRLDQGVLDFGDAS